MCFRLDMVLLGGPISYQTEKQSQETTKSNVSLSTEMRDEWRPGMGMDMEMEMAKSRTVLETPSVPLVRHRSQGEQITDPAQFLAGIVRRQTMQQKRLFEQHMRVLKEQQHKENVIGDGDGDGRQSHRTGEGSSQHQHDHRIDSAGSNRVTIASTVTREGVQTGCGTHRSGANSSSNMKRGKAVANAHRHQSRPFHAHPNVRAHVASRAHKAHPSPLMPTSSPLAHSRLPVALHVHPMMDSSSNALQMSAIHSWQTPPKPYRKPSTPAQSKAAKATS